MLGYLIGLVPLIALLLMFRQLLSQTLALGLMGVGVMASLWVQQRVRAKFPFDFRAQGEWLALELYTVLVVVVTVVLYHEVQTNP